MTRGLTSYLGFSIITAMVLAGSVARPALAASSTTSIGGDVNSIDQKVNQLITIRDDDSLTSAEKAVKEFQAQQDILNGVIDLSNNEIASVKDKLDALPKFDKDSPEDKLRSGYLDELDSYSAYFSIEKDKVTAAANIDDLKAIAADIKTYRAGGYNDEIQNMVTFALLYYDADVIATAQTRLDKVKVDIAKLQSLGLLKKGFTQSSLDKAAGLISDAAKLQSQAKDLILEPPQTATDQTTDETTTSDKTTTNAGTTVTPPPTPRDLVSKSIGEIKSAYNIFLRISKDVRKALGLK